MLNEEKIKAFFNDEEKVKEFMNDEEFINKVSECQATPEIYVEKFKKFGIELSEEEAKAVQETVEKIMEKPVEELDESALKDISGGVTGKQVAAGIALTAAGAVGGFRVSGCGMSYSR